jgi:hypothetical protein
MISLFVTGDRIELKPPISTYFENKVVKMIEFFKGLSECIHIHTQENRMLPHKHAAFLFEEGQYEKHLSRLCEIAYLLF